MTGHLVGGWGYVVAAYSFTGTVLVAYLASLALRFRAESRAENVAAEAAALEAAHGTAEVAP